MQFVGAVESAAHVAQFGVGELHLVLKFGDAQLDLDVSRMEQRIAFLDARADVNINLVDDAGDAGAERRRLGRRYGAGADDGLDELLGGRRRLKHADGIGGLFSLGFFVAVAAPCQQAQCRYGNDGDAACVRA